MHKSHRQVKRKTVQKKQNQIDRLVYLAVIIGPLLTIPQVYAIWIEGQRGVSVISWVAYLVASLIWLAYGIKHHDKPILIVETAWIILDLFIIIGLIRLQ